MPGPTELILILLIILILFGAGKLPQVFESLGTGLKKFREAQEEEPPAPRDVSPPRPEISESKVVHEAEELRDKHGASAE